MGRENYLYKTPASKLVQVASIAAEYRDRPDMLMMVLIRVQAIVPALSKAVVTVIAREMNIPRNQVYSFVTFYAMLSVKPQGRYIIRMCKSAPCHVHGAKEVVDVVITSDSWQVERNAAGQPIRRVIFGYSIVQTEHGKMATRVSWAEDHQGGGKYGGLRAYGNGMESYYVK